MAQDEINPYVGPRPFERKEEDSKRFFGRTQETQEIVSFIFGHPVTLVYAQSGAGKTSLFNTSVTLSLEKKGFDVLPLTRVGGAIPQGISPRDIKNLYVFNALLKMDSETDPRSLSSKSLSDFLEMRAQKTTEEDSQPRPRAIIFDQFEELFTYTPEDWREQRNGFFSQVVEALEADQLLRVVFVIREDFVAELDPYARDLPERLRIRYRLERLGENAALRAIKDPLASTSRKFAPGVAEGLVKQLLTIKTVDASGKMTEIEGQHVEPVQLQVVCVTLWSALGPEVTEIQQSHLKNFDVSDALSDFYKSAIDAAVKEADVGEADLRNWFGNTLITPMGTRNTVFRGEKSTGGIDNNVVDFLVSRHIIHAEFRAGARWYELNHDRLVEPIIASNEEWFAANLSMFQQQAALWAAQGRPEGMLLRGEELDKALQEVAAESKTISKDERDFLAACERERKREQREKRSNLLNRILAVVSTIALIATIIFFVLFSRESNESDDIKAAAQGVVATSTAQKEEDQLKEAARQAEATAEAFTDNLAKEARDALSIPKTWSLGRLLAVEAYNINHGLGDDSIRSSVFQALFESAGKGNDIPLKNGSFSSAVFDNTTNNEWLIVDNILWNLKSFQDYPLIDIGQVLQSAFRPNGEIVLVVDNTSSSSGNQSSYTVLIKDTKNQDIDQFSIDLPEAYVATDVRLSDDGNWLVLGYGRKQNVDSSDTLQTGIVQLWDTRNPTSGPIKLSVQNTPDVASVAISYTDDEKAKLAVVDAKNQVYLWVDGNEKDTFNFFGTPALKKDGDLPDAYIDGVFIGKSGNGLQFSSDGRWLAILSKSRIQIYDTKLIDTKGEIRLGEIKLQGSYVIPNETIITSLLFSPDNNYLAFTSNDYSDCKDFYYLYNNRYEFLTYDGYYQLSGNYNCDPNSKTFLWQFTGGNPLPQIIAANTDAEFTAMDYSDAGKLMVGDRSGYIRDWDLTDLLSTSAIQPLHELNVHNGRVTNILVGSDNKFTVSAGDGDGTRLWSIQEDEETAVVRISTFNTASIVMKSEGANGDLLIMGGSDTRDEKGIVQIYSNFQDPINFKSGNNSADDSSIDDGRGTIVALAISEKWIVAGRYKPFAYSSSPYLLDIWDRASTDTDAASITFQSDLYVTGLTFAPDGEHIAVVTGGRDVYLTTINDLLSQFKEHEVTLTSTPTVDTATETPVVKATLPSLQKSMDKLSSELSGIRYVLFVEGGSYLLIASTTGINIIDIENLQNIVPYHAVYPLGISLNQRWLVTASDDGTGVHLYDLFSPDGVRSSPIIVPVDNPVTQFSFSSDNNKLAVATNIGNVLIYDLTLDLNQEETKLYGSNSITQLEFSTDRSEGEWLIAKGESAVYLWDLENPQDDPVELREDVVYAGFSQDGSQIITIAKDETLRLWSMNPDELVNTACYYAGRNFLPEEADEYFLERNKKTCDRYEVQTISNIPTPSPTSYPTAALYQTPTPTSFPTATPTPPFIYYEVQAGDTLSGIANRFGIDLEILRQDNKDIIREPDIISPGQQMKIRVLATPTVTVVP